MSKLSKKTMFAQFKGMNRLADISNMSGEYLWDIYNGYLSKENSIKLTRFGYSKQYAAQVDSGADVLNMFEAIYDDGSTDFFVTTATKILRWDSSGGDWTEIKTGLSTVTFTHIAQYGDDVVFSDGVNTPQTFTKGGASTSNFTMPGGVTSFSYIHIHQNRMWAVDADNKYMIYYSALGDIEDWTTSGDAGAGYLNMIANISKGDSVVKIETFSSAFLAFFMKDHVFIYTIGTVASDFVITQTIVNTGIPGANAAMSFGNDLYYMDLDAPKSLVSAVTNEELTVTDFTKFIMGDYYRDLIEGVTGNRILIEKYHRQSWVVMFIPIGDGGEFLIWDYALKAWSGRWRVYHKVNRLLQNNEGNLLFCSEGYVYVFDESVYTDDGETVENYTKTPFYWGVNPAAYEKLVKVEVLAETETTSTTLEVSVYYEYEGSSSTYEEVSLSSAGALWDVALWDVASWDASGQDLYSVRCLGKGKMKRLMFRNNQSAKDVTVKMWQLFPKTLNYI